MDAGDLGLGNHHGSVLSGEKLTTVRACGCGIIHLTLGAMTLNLTLEAFQGIAATLSNAAAELKRVAASREEEPSEGPGTQAVVAPFLRLVPQFAVSQDTP